jgi:hypothetical protein
MSFGVLFTHPVSLRSALRGLADVLDPVSERGR